MSVCNKENTKTAIEINFKDSKIGVMMRFCRLEELIDANENKGRIQG